MKKDFNKIALTKWFRIMESQPDDKGRTTITEAYEVPGLGVSIKVTDVIINDKPNHLPAVQDNTISVAGWFVEGATIQSTEVNGVVFNEIIKA